MEKNILIVLITHLSIFINIIFNAYYFIYR